MQVHMNIDTGSQYWYLLYIQTKPFTFMPDLQIDVIGTFSVEHRDISIAVAVINIFIGLVHVCCSFLCIHAKKLNVIHICYTRQTTV